MTSFKEQSITIRARDALAKLRALSKVSLAGLHNMSLPAVLAELEAWGAVLAPEHLRILSQHGF